MPPDKVRVLTGNVGGSFGMKSQVYPEYGPLLLASKPLGRPVKWTDERSESFLSDHHGRDHQRVAELALDKDGNFLAVRLTGTGNAGAYIYPPMPATTNAVKNVIDVYRDAGDGGELQGRVHQHHADRRLSRRRPARGQLLHGAADRHGGARDGHRPRSSCAGATTSRPEQMPYKAPSGMNYDSGEFTTVLDKALAGRRLAGLRQAQGREQAPRNKLRGRGIGSYLEVTGPPAKEYGGIRFEDDGTVTMLSGTLDYGQGHATPFAQVLSDKLGIPFERFRLLQGDSDQLKVGGGTGGSKSALVASQAFLEAGDKLIEKGKQIAAHVLEASAADIEFARGRFTIAGTDRGISIIELADRLRVGSEAAARRAAVARRQPHLRQSAVLVPQRLPHRRGRDRPRHRPDRGRALFHGQRLRHGHQSDAGRGPGAWRRGARHRPGADGAHGLRRRRASRVAGSYMDYALPRASDAPDLSVENHSVPCKTNRLGVKGCGEAGCAGALPSVMNAVVDALSEVGVTHIDMPVTPEKVWRALNSG